MGVFCMNHINRVGTLRTVTVHETDGGLTGDKATLRIRAQLTWEHGFHENPMKSLKAHLELHLICLAQKPIV